MLQELHVCNFGLIDDLVITFDKGLNVLTGETGAGKTMVVDAISAVLGGRISPDQVRSGADSCLIEAVFSIPPESRLARRLEEEGYAVDPDGLLILSREFSRQARSRCRINGRITNAASLSQIGAYLVDIHGQHEQQSLLKPERQLDLLDAFIGEKALSLRSRVEELVTRLRDARRELCRLSNEEKEASRRAEFLRFQQNEIQSAKLSEGEEANLLAERSVLASAEKLFFHATGAYTLLYSDEAGGVSCQELMAKALGEVESAAKVDARLAPLVEVLQSALASVQQVSRDLRGYIDKIEFNPSRLSLIEERLAFLQELKRKYAMTIPEIIQYGKTISQELEHISMGTERIAQLEREIPEMTASLGQLCMELSSLRKDAASALAASITRELAGLAMPGATFHISLTSVEDPEGVPVGGRRVQVGPRGCDMVEFLVSSNPGEAPRPLARVASGGELSRIMLAIRAILAESDEIPTVIFDEVDAGVGGRAAANVAQKLAAIGRARQTLCVTHLAQIASVGDAHFYISKEVVGERTRSKVVKLDSEERVVELARMLSGDTMSDITLQHAREILNSAYLLKTAI
ncbi:MAG TPA: DNA repair protein RecN [Firmicutes bacterium]|nr:DNA repair protein RecN [Bacillota bacterium]